MHLMKFHKISGSHFVVKYLQSSDTVHTKLNLLRLSDIKCIGQFS